MKLDFELFIKYFSGEASPQEAEQVENFAESSPEGYAYLEALFKSWLESEDKVYEKPNIQKEWERFNSRHLEKTPKRFLKIASWAAALAIVLGIAGYFTYFKNTTSVELISVNAKENQELVLMDSSKIFLATGSRVEYKNTFNKNNRELELWGDASFDVQHNNTMPFIIHLQNNLNVKVLGTVFSISESDKSLKVKLQKGSVLFYNQKDSMRLMAGQTGEFIFAKNEFLLELPFLKTGSFQFKNQALRDVAAQLNQYFEVSIYFKNPKLEDCRLSAGIEDKNLEQIINIIAVTFNLNYNIEKNKIILDGASCD